MNPWSLSATDIAVWGIILHLIADWPLQNDWMANNKMKRRIRAPRRGNGMITPPRMYQPSTPWWDRHPAAYVHAGIHGILLSVIFGWVAFPLAVIHLIIDTRAPLVWWGKTIRQTQPGNLMIDEAFTNDETFTYKNNIPLYDVGLEVRFWTDQVFHIACLAVAALLVA